MTSLLQHLRFVLWIVPTLLSKLFASCGQGLTRSFKSYRRRHTAPIQSAPVTQNPVQDSATVIAFADVGSSPRNSFPNTQNQGGGPDWLKAS